MTAVNTRDRKVGKQETVGAIGTCYSSLRADSTYANIWEDQALQKSWGSDTSLSLSISVSDITSSVRAFLFGSPLGSSVQLQLFHLQEIAVADCSC